MSAFATDDRPAALAADTAHHALRDALDDLGGGVKDALLAVRLSRGEVTLTAEEQAALVARLDAWAKKAEEAQDA